MKREYITKELIKKIHKKILHLENVERLKISKKIKEAREQGDLSENSEYDAAKKEQEILEIKILNIKKKLSKYIVINPDKLDHSKVSIFSTVKIKNISLQKEETYTLVPEGENNIKKNKISINTPIALGLIGKSIGDTSNIKLPNGKIIKLHIIDIFYKKK
ncbi:transcription elongation factor GreA [Candidatus Shikimatogenerans silvanidophilus]|uniref:transcription elongation factor GreA n=1 Tax=Candidatus Shikimatogenerans silvanidophilus TaxID=2782547 RepID=UPI001BA9D295|nr:transcription elongation factor GreA [Candidatus Shikimatogenerans silvanidophilus]